MTNVGAWASLVLLVGDAFAQANPDQLRLLRQEVPKCLAEVRDQNSERWQQGVKDLAKTLVRVMGDDWMIDAETAKWINGLMGQ